METTVRYHAPKTYKRLMRNHFQSGSDWPVSRSFGNCDPNYSCDDERALTASQTASNRSRWYRFGKVNAIRSITQLAGDDLSVLETNE